WEVLVYSPALKQEFRVSQAAPHPEYQRAADQFHTAEREFRAKYEELQKAQKTAEEESPIAGKPAEKKDGKPERKDRKPSAPLSAKEAQALVKQLARLEDRMLEAMERQVHFDVGAL